jgi:hypothetical protein
MLLRRSSYILWILAVDGYSELCLINPFTRAQIRLPPLYTFSSVLRFDPNVPNEEYLIYRERSYLSNQKTHSRDVPFFRNIFICKIACRQILLLMNIRPWPSIYGELWFLASILKYPIA